ncbi:MAG TPA: type II secretion system protein GspG, partial [Chthoniobacteraceae bacterium]|nr:type II secretion system protein GspG [Chthoniobacteraceae bacterium]
MRPAVFCAMVALVVVVLLIATRQHKFGCGMTKVEVDIDLMSLALTTYARHGGTLPSTAQGLRALVERPTSDPVPADWVQQMSSLP